MNSRISGLFKTSEKELRFIDQATMFYSLYVVMFTIDDLKGGNPTYLIILGIAFHTLTFLTLRQVNCVIFTKNGDVKRPNYFKKNTNLVYKIVPFGLVLTYTVSAMVGMNDNISIYGYLLFMWTTSPILVFLFTLGYSKKKFLSDFRRKIPIVNYAYIGGFVLLVLFTANT